MVPSKVGCCGESRKEVVLKEVSEVEVGGVRTAAALAVERRVEKKSGTRHAKGIWKVFIVKTTWNVGIGDKIAFCFARPCPW